MVGAKRPDEGVGDGGLRMSGPLGAGVWQQGFFLSGRFLDRHDLHLRSVCVSK